mgnify:CR=1 FL=1
MKKTEKMNIGGFAFYVEEDAAEMLEGYLDSIRKEYDSEPSRDEICSDIEERIGELLAEKSPRERIVTVEMVNYAKSVMGEFGAPGGASGPETRQAAKRRLFRDLDSRFLGGVFSGLSAFTDVDVVIYRVTFTILCLAGIFIDKDWSHTILGLLLLGYLVMWICVPAAKTVEQKCQLYGKPISVNDFSRNAAQTSYYSGSSERKPAPAVNLAGRICLIILGVVLLMCGTGLLVGCATFDMIPRIVHNFVEDAEAISVIDTIFSTSVTVSFTISTILLALWNIYSGVLLIFNLNSPKWRPGLILILTFLLSMLAFFIFVVRAALNVPMLF